MAEEEKRPSIDLTALADTAAAGRITDGIHTVDVTRQGDLFLVQVSTREQSLFSAAVTPDNRVHIVFEAQLHAAAAPLDHASLQPPQHEPAVEPEPTPEHPPITIEGYPISPATYEKDKQTGKAVVYKLTIAHHPDPSDRKKAIYYDIRADGDKAEACFRAYITDTRNPVRITGTDCTETIKRKNKPDKIVRRIQAESVERIRGRRDLPDILREKVRLADRE